MAIVISRKCFSDINSDDIENLVTDMSLAYSISDMQACLDKAKELDVDVRGFNEKPVYSNAYGIYVERVFIVWMNSAKKGCTCKVKCNNATSSVDGVNITSPYDLDKFNKECRTYGYGKTETEDQELERLDNAEDDGSEDEGFSMEGPQDLDLSDSLGNLKTPDEEVNDEPKAKGKVEKDGVKYEDEYSHPKAKKNPFEI